MRLMQSSLHPYEIEIEGETYQAQRLTLGDLCGIAESLFIEQRKAAEPAEDADQEAREAAWKAREAISPMSPAQMLSWLLSSARGQAVALWTALHKQHPEITMERVLDFAWTDELVQACFDLLEVRRVPRGTAGEGEHRPDPPSYEASGELEGPYSATFTPDCPGVS